jgi:hypothetical protein
MSVSNKAGLDWMIAFICHLIQSQLGTKGNYRTTADFYTLQFIVPHALGFLVSTSRSLATDLNTGNITSNYYDVS